jgi:plasmid stability protein
LLFHEGEIAFTPTSWSHNSEDKFMANLQVMGLDDKLYKALRARAASENRSISQEIVTIIEAYLSQHKTEPHRATSAFLKLAGTWV